MKDADQNNLTADIEREEAWLREVMEQYPTPRCRSLEHVKLRVRIAVQEGGLELGPAPVPSGGVLERLKRSVRSELAKPVQPDGEQVLRLPAWRVGRLAGVSLAAAAGVVLLVSPMFWKGEGVSNGIAQVQPWEDFVAVMSSGSAEQEVELLRIEDELDQLEDSLRQPRMLGDVSELQELDDRIERLLAENAAGFDT